MHASHVVVDEHDGYTFWRDAEGRMFGKYTADLFARQRNSEMKPEHPKYVVYRLVKENDGR